MNQIENTVKNQRYSGLPDSLKIAFKKIDDQALAESRKRMSSMDKESKKILEKLNSDSFMLRKDLLMLTGTIFGSSIALASGREVNIYFIVGEFFILLSIISGLINVISHLKAKEWEYAFTSKNNLDSFLILNKNRIEEFELNALKNLVEDYRKIMESNQSGVYFKLLKFISIEKWPSIFYILFLIGMLLILISIIPDQTVYQRIEPVSRFILE